MQRVGTYITLLHIVTT